MGKIRRHGACCSVKKYGKQNVGISRLRMRGISNKKEYHERNFHRPKPSQCNMIVNLSNVPTAAEKQPTAAAK
jgi:hypothetical protein